MSISLQKVHHHSGTLSPEFVLLGFLVSGPRHGYDLHQQFVAELGNVWHLSQSQAYAILKRLENKGDISVRLVEQDRLPARQMLYITAAGRQRFMDWLENDHGDNARSIRLEFLTRLYFSNLYTPENTANIYATQCVEIENSIRRLEGMIASLPAEQAYNHLSLDLRLRQMKLIQEWMGEIKNRFHIPTRGSK
jgi:PadR family transcriptional regulator, regulatory protein AphA